MSEAVKPSPAEDIPLADRRCIPCEGGVPPLEGETLKAFLSRMEGWKLDAEGHLTKGFGFKDFAEALAFVNRVGAVAESEFHHPDLHLAWGKVRVEIWTHKIDGLTESDFIFAAKCDRISAG